MKRKNVVLIVSSVVMVLLAVALLYRYLAPPTKGSGIMVVVPHPVVPTFNQDQLNTLKNDTVDFSQNIAPKTSQLNGGNQANASQNVSNIEPQGQ
jgi:LPS O-antigen subunit length determinant protein (WzzB/FepE family)